MKNYLTSVAAYLTGWALAHYALGRLVKQATSNTHLDITRKIASDLADELEKRAVERERDIMGVGSVH